MAEECALNTEDAWFEVLAPREWVTPIIFNSPHSGQFLPPHFLTQSVLSAHDLRSSEDCYVDELFAGCVDQGIPLLRALISRAYIDLNREPFEFDPKLFQEALPGYMNTTTSRVTAGLGTIPRFVGESQAVYRAPLILSEAVQRVETIYRPYHQLLSNLIQEAYNATGLCILIDCHSMPSSAISHEAKNGKTLDVVIGDRFGASAAREYVDVLETAFQAEGLHVKLNRPYAGGFITENHGDPRFNRHAIQIEVNRALYMNEMTLQKNAGFQPLRSALNRICAKLIIALPDQQRLAAE